MGKGRDKRRRKPNKQGQRTREERDLLKEKEMERAERVPMRNVERSSLRNT
jgi:hypothetical protein